MSTFGTGWRRGASALSGMVLALVSVQQGRHLLASDESAYKSLAHTHSSPIAVSPNDKSVWSVNPDNNSVTVFDVEKDANTKLAEIPVGKEPWCVVLTPDGEKAYVSNMASGTVSVIDVSKYAVVKTIRVESEPFGCALTPDGSRLYIANQSSNSVSVINTRRDVVIKTIDDVGAKPHGLAITPDGKTVYVTQFLALPRKGDPRPLTQSEGADDGREGLVTVINARSNHVIGPVRLAPIVENVFRSDGNSLGREPLSTPPVFDNVTGAFPNLLESIIIQGGIAYVTGTCSSPNGPFRFNVNVHGCLSGIDLSRNAEAFETLNMNRGVQFEPVGTRLFNTNPFAAVFKRAGDEGFVTLGATNRLLRISLNSGVPTINPPAAPGSPSGIVRIELKDPAELGVSDPAEQIGGKNPRGLAINSTDTRVYVMDFVSRDVAVVDVSGVPTEYRTIARLASASLPDPASAEGIVQRGKQLFNSAIGPEGTADNSRRPAGLMSDFGWGTCYSCHPQGLTDTVTWMFADGPRQAISMESTFELEAVQIVDGAPVLPASHQRALNWSAVRDEVQDFSRNIRAVSGGGGLVAGVPEGVAGLGQVPDLVGTANTGRSRDLDAIATYIALGIRAPIAPISSRSPRALLGRAVFERSGCQTCHGGKNWTISALDYTPPAVATDVVDAQLNRFLCRVGTFDAGLFTDGVSNEIRANNAANVQARGVLGFNVPSLLSVFASAPYLHSGAAPTLNSVLDNVTHRTAGNRGGFDLLQVNVFRALLVDFVTSIDRDTEPFDAAMPPTDLCGPQP